jgi:hypothetical protein
MKVLSDVLGESWDQKATSAWGTIWSRAAKTMGRNLSIGSNLITVALVRGDLEKFQQAIELAPRRDRADWLCRCVCMCGSVSVSVCVCTVKVVLSKDHTFVVL